MALMMFGSVLMGADAGRPHATSATAPQWVLFVPKGDENAGCRFEPAGAGGGGTLSSDVTARFGIWQSVMRVAPGARYRLKASFKPRAGFRVEPGSPGVVLRATLFSAPGIDLPSGHLFVGSRGIAQGEPGPLATDGPSPQEVRIEGVIEIPAGVHEMIPFVFCWQTAGHVDVGGLTVERVDRSVPVSPMVAAAR